MATQTTAIRRDDFNMNYGEFNLAMNRAGFVGLKILPRIVVPHQSAEFKRLPTEEIFKQDLNTERAAGGDYDKVDFKWKTDSYFTRDHGREHAMDDRQLKIYRDFIQEEAIAAEILRDVVLSSLENDILSAILAAAIPATAIAPALKWSDHATAKPLDDLILGRQKIEDQTKGLMVTDCFLSQAAVDHLRSCDTVLERIKYTSVGSYDPMLPNEALFRALSTHTGIPRFHVAKAYKNTANEGEPAPTTRFWDQTKVLLSISDTGGGSLRSPKPRLGNTLQWSEESNGTDGDEIALIYEEYRDEKHRGGVMRARSDWGTKILDVDCGHMLNGVL